MKIVKIYGASDDLIEIEGDIRDEFASCDGGWWYLHFDTGLVLRIGYSVVSGKGWAIEIEKQPPPPMTVTHHDPILYCGDHYSDYVVVTGPFARIECWSDADGPLDEELVERLQDVDWQALESGQLKRAYAATRGD